MAKRKTLTAPSADDLARLEDEFRRETTSRAPLSAPISHIAAEAAAAHDPRSPDDRAAAARDRTNGDDAAVVPAREAMRILHELALAQPLVDRELWFTTALALVDGDRVHAACGGLLAGLLYLGERLTEDALVTIVGRRLGSVVDPAAALLAEARIGGRRVAAMLFLLHAPWASYHVGWSGEAGRRSNAHALLLWQAMLRLREEGCTVLDLGDVDTERAPVLARFKIGTGAPVARLGATVLLPPW